MTMAPSATLEISCAPAVTIRLRASASSASL
jgi:hypothetical protein